VDDVTGQALGGHLPRQHKGRPQVDVQVFIPGRPLDLGEGVIPEQGRAVDQQGDRAQRIDDTADKARHFAFVVEITGKETARLSGLAHFRQRGPGVVVLAAAVNGDVKACG